MPGEDKKADGKFEKEKLIDRGQEWMESSYTIDQFSDLFLEIIIFYGNNIDCYCALQGLLEFGVDGSWITLIQPTLAQCTTYDQAFFDDCEVRENKASWLLPSDKFWFRTRVQGVHGSDGVDHEEQHQHNHGMGID